jgi:hypothetical protein
VPIPYRHLWAYLPCYADREGRLEDRPLMLKGEVFPADDVNVGEMLTAFSERGWIIRYQAKGKKLIQIVSFHDYQRPDHHERTSVLPPPEGWTRDKTGKFAQAMPRQCPGKPTETAGIPPECNGNAAPVIRISGDPDPDPHTQGVCARSNPPANEPGKPSPHNVVSRFLAIRAEVIGGSRGVSTPFAQPQPNELQKAEKWLSVMTGEESQDIEPAIRLACKHVAGGASGWTHESITKTGFLFGAIVTNWRDLREELHGCAPNVAKPKGKDKPAPTVTPIREW